MNLEPSDLVEKAFEYKDETFTKSVLKGLSHSSENEIIREVETRVWKQGWDNVGIIVLLDIRHR